MRTRKKPKISETRSAGSGWPACLFRIFVTGKPTAFPQVLAGPTVLVVIPQLKFILPSRKNQNDGYRRTQKSIRISRSSTKERMCREKVFLGFSE